MVQEPTLLTTSPCGLSRFFRALNARLRDLEFALYLINKHIRIFIHKAEHYWLVSGEEARKGQEKSAFSPTKEAK